MSDPTSTESSAWSEQVAEFVITKAIPTLFASGVGGVIALIGTSELPKIALGAGIGGAASVGYSLVSPSLKKAKKGVDQIGEAGAETAEKTAKSVIAFATGAEAKYLEAQKLACWTDRTQGMSCNFVPLLNDIYVPLSIGDRAILGGWEEPLDAAQAGQPLYIWDLIRRAEKKPEYRQMAILAWGGYGKTTLLKHLAYIYSTQRHEEKDVPGRIPVLISLGECWRKYLAKQGEDDKPLPNLVEVIRSYHIPQLPGATADLKTIAPSWVETLLLQGKAIVLLDGFDEVPKAKRPILAQWINRQTKDYRKTIFILTSRPKAYQEEAKVDRIVLPTIWVKPFNAGQQRQFVEQWYRCREIDSNSRRDTADVIQIAQAAVEELLGQIQDRPEIQDLAKIPLLLNMISSFHRDNRKARLPRRKVELYQGICDLQLKIRLEAKDLDTQLGETNAQKILQRLALEMLLNNREKSIDQATLLKRLDVYLKAENETLDAKQFLEDVVRISELLIEKDADTYEFTHWSFQEYLAAREIVQEQREILLYDKFMEKEWQPTILLYAAQVKRPDALIQSMLDRGAGDLAYACLQETTKQVSPALQQELKLLQPAVQTSRYSKLKELLQAKQWREADQETYRLMITTVDKEEGQWFDPEDLSNFPCEDLGVLDDLWVRYSDGKWGFSVQKRIWQECGSPGPYDEKTKAQWEQFGDRVGWRKDGNWLEYENFALASTGELPTCWGGLECTDCFSFLFSRVQTCKL
jgi:GUN4-like/NACHT domain